VADPLVLPGLPFPLDPSAAGGWRVDGDDVVAEAPGHTDLYVNPGGSGSADAESLLNAATLLGRPPGGDFSLSARVSVDFAARFDAGVLLLWADERH
jgi:hypothetical protein